MAVPQRENLPLWKRGSHLSQRYQHHGSTPALPKGRGVPGSRVPVRASDEVGDWLRAHPESDVRVHPDEVPGGEIAPRSSGVFGAYGSLPQVTCRLFDAYTASDPAPRPAGQGTVPRHDRSNRLLAVALGLPIVTHHFA